MTMDKQYKAVFFDLGGTLRISLLKEPYMRHARRKMAEIAAVDTPYEEFCRLIEERYKAYRKWAAEELKEAGDEELWCKWLLPDHDPAHIQKICHEMSYLFRQTMGYRVMVDGGEEVIRTLHARGYKLGIISNIIGENEVPDWLEEEELDQCFGAVILSSVCHQRKPGPGIYLTACRALGVAPEDCVSVADNVKRDIPGAKKARIGCNIIFDSPEKRHPVIFDDATRPDVVITDFRELLDMLSMPAAE